MWLTRAAYRRGVKASKLKGSTEDGPEAPHMPEDLTVRDRGGGGVGGTGGVVHGLLGV